MSIDLTVREAISATPQPVCDQAGNQSGVQLASNETRIVGTDSVGGSLPLVVVGEETQGETYNRLLRLQGASGDFFDIGIDAAGTLFVNNSRDGADAAPVLSITQDGVVRIKNLMLPFITQGGTTDLTVDGNGKVFKQ
jgi:hypothetical protein